MEAIVPHVITAEQAADALGLTITELARNISEAAQQRLTATARKIEGFQIGSLEEFDEEIAGARRQFESLLACWQIIDGYPGSPEDDE